METDNNSVAPDHDNDSGSPIRRPMNAFLIFCKRHRSVVREKHPNLDNRSITRILGDMWAKLGATEKSLYTNLAKQYKEAFMKANPDFKWHNPEKIPQVASKPVTRPSNARVVVPTKKNMMEQQGHTHSDSQGHHTSDRVHNNISNNNEGIVPGKLADPSQMGGLNLLFMASQSKPGQKGDTEKRRHSSGDNTALLELAEMCTSELQHETRKSPDTTYSHLTDKMSLINMTAGDADDSVHMTTIDTSEEGLQRFASQKMEHMKMVECSQNMVEHVIDSLYSVHKSQAEQTKAQDSSHNMYVPPQGNNAFNLQEMVRPVQGNQRSELTNHDNSGLTSQNANFKIMNSAPKSISFTDQSMAPLVAQSSMTTDISDIRVQDSNADKVPTPNEFTAIKLKIKPEKHVAIKREIESARREERKSWTADSSRETDDIIFCQPTVRPFRKRTMSESDKLDRGKKYRTGGFDLEAHIANLPPCSIDDLSRKRNRSLTRKRHHSEGSKRTHSEIRLERTTSLHEMKISPLALPLREDNMVPLVPLIGSQKRKARKSSITHLVPAADSNTKDPPNSASASQHQCNPVSGSSVQSSQTSQTGDVQRPTSNVLAAPQPSATKSKFLMSSSASVAVAN